MLAACNTLTSPHENYQKDSILNAAAVIPEFRNHVQESPVASYSVRTEDSINEWYFRVHLYETYNTFHYLVKLQYEEIRGTDTLKLPNFGMMPRPVIRKGPEKYSCIIGFLDKDSSFREYKKVYVKNNSLKIAALRHYAVYTYQKEK